jgi:hypothetical protein
LLVFSKQFANLVGGDKSPWVWTESFFNVLAIEYLRRPHDSLIQGLNFVAAVRWKANYENPGPLLLIASFIFRSPIFTFEPSVIWVIPCQVNEWKNPTISDFIHTW